MANAFGVRVKPRVSQEETLVAEVDLDSYTAADFADIIDAWLPVTFAIISVNRAMGNADLYPFVLSPAVIAKLSLVHDIVHTHPM